MKRHLSIFFAILAVLVVFPTNALAAPGSKKVTLSSIEYQRGGIVLLFETSGLTKADLRNNSFYADSNNQKMSCNFVNHTTTVRCVVARSLAGHGDFRATLAGFAFWGRIPERKGCSGGEVAWYLITGYQDGEVLGTVDIPVWLWNEFVDLGILEAWADAGITADFHDYCAPDIDLVLPT